MDEWEVMENDMDHIIGKISSLKNETIGVYIFYTDWFCYNIVSI